jgi:hypothetical protein
MTGYSLSTKLFKSALLAGLIATTGSVTAVADGLVGNESIVVNYSECGSEVGLTVRDALASDVLRVLSVELGFELHIESDEDLLITTELHQPPRELLENLSTNDNIIIMAEPDYWCGADAERITTVWFLGVGPDVVYETLKAEAVPGVVYTKPYKKEGKKRRALTEEERHMDKQQRRAAKGKY